MPTMRIAAYEFIAPQGRFAISWRPYGRWRVRGAGGAVIDRSFASAQLALQEVIALQWPVPADLDDWIALPAFADETLPSDLTPLDLG
ncbi:MAG: hypothetical protein ABW005_11270 [Burkholderiaceae bacterium]